MTDAKTGKRKKAQRRGFRTKQDAEAFLVDINAKDAQGILQQETNVTVKDFLDNWLKDYPGIGELRESTVESYRLHMEKYVYPRIGCLPLKKVTGTDFEKMYADLKDHGCLRKEGNLSGSTVAYIHRILGEAMKFAIRQGLIMMNPMERILRPPVRERYEGTSYTPEELQQLLNLVHDTNLELPIALAGLCGLRRGECLGIRVEDVDFDKNILYIRRQIKVSNSHTVYQEKPKTENSIRQVPILPLVKELIRKKIDQNAKKKDWLGEAYHDDGWIICNDDGTWVNPNLLTQRFSAFIRRHNFKKIRFHDLRHTYASLMLESGGSLKVVSAMMGHSTITITADIYAHVGNDQKQDAAMKFSEMLFGEKKKEEPSQ